MLRSALLLALAAVTLAACDSGTGLEAPTASATADDDHVRGGAVFTLSDADGPNEVLVLDRGFDGSLRQTAAVPTGGTGSGGGLGAATDAIVFSPDGTFLYAVNRGSDEVSVFQADGQRLRLRQVVPSGGVGPIGIAVRDGLVYVLNTGDGSAAGTVAVFQRRLNGRLRAIPQWTVTFPTDGSAAGLTQVGFAPSRRAAVVTAREAGTLFTFPVADNGRPGRLVATASSGMTPFGFDFDATGNLYVSNAAGGAPDASSVSAYALTGTALTPIEAEVPTTETAACWLRVDGDYFWVTNTGSGTITGYAIQPDGSVEILDADGVTAVTGANPRDLNVADGVLYAQSDGRIDAYRIGAGGSLAPLATAAVPATARGVAVR